MIRAGTSTAAPSEVGSELVGKRSNEEAKEGWIAVVVEVQLQITWTIGRRDSRAPSVSH
jgi:hypothetical protein